MILTSQADAPTPTVAMHLRSIAEICTSHMNYLGVEVYPSVFTLMDYTSEGSKCKNLEKIQFIQLGECPNIAAYLTHLDPHIHILWGSQVLFNFLSETSAFQLIVMNLSRDVVEGMNLIQVAVDPY